VQQFKDDRSKCLIIPSSQCCVLFRGTDCGSICLCCVYGVKFKMEKYFYSENFRLHYHSLILPHSSSSQKILCVHVYTDLTLHVFIGGKAVFSMQTLDSLNALEVCTVFKFKPELGPYPRLFDLTVPLTVTAKFEALI